MQVILQKDVKDLGKVGDVVNVSQGYARNFLFPNKMAAQSSEKNVKDWAHHKQVADMKLKKVASDRKEFAEKVNGQTVNFKMAASEADVLFGSVTAIDVSKELGKAGFEVDKRDINLEAIKTLGQFKAKINFGSDVTAEVTVSVERD